MIYITERHVEDYLHVLANVNVIKIISGVYPNDEICFISAQKHSQKVNQYFDSRLSKLIFKPFKNRSENTNLFSRFFSLIKKVFDDTIFFNKLLKKIGRHDVLFISHIYPHSLIALNLLKFFHSKSKVFVILHGEVEYVFFKKNLAQKLIGLLYKLSFYIKSKRLYYIFLTKASEEVFRDTSYITKGEIISIELPTFTETNNSIAQNSRSFPVKIGHIGSAGKRKNVDKLYGLAERNIELITNKKIEFSVIGVLEESIRPHLNDLVLNYVNNQINFPLERQQYDYQIRKIDYAVFFYDDNDFLLRSSAAVFDAVFYEKPIIALNNRFFEALFLKHGQMGYLCNTLSEMDDLIKTIVTGIDCEQYGSFVKNIKAYKNSLDINNITDDLKSQLENISIQ